MTWNVMQGSVWKDIANCRTKQRKWDLLENCLKFAHKLFYECLYLARIGRLDF